MPALPFNERRELYDDVMRVTMSDWRTSGALAEYLAERSKRFWHFTYTNLPNLPRNPFVVTLERFEAGRTAGSKQWSFPSWLPSPAKYAILYVVYLLVLLLSLPRGAWIISHHPVFCVGQARFRRLKGQRLLYWVWDRYDDEYPAYTRLDESCVRAAPYLLFISKPMAAAYAASAQSKPDPKVRKVLSLGVRTVTPAAGDPIVGRLGFIGNLRHNDGLQTVIEAIATDDRYTLDVIGFGEHSDRLRKRVRELGLDGRVRFHGQVFDPAALAEIIGRWQISLAPYRDSPSSFYGDSCKVKDYLQFGLPVLMTPTMDMHRELASENAGEIVPLEPAMILQALRKMTDDPKRYAAGVSRLAGKYEYHALYDEGLSFMRMQDAR